ncbi:MAG: phosphomannomutase/phosphoglucomutase [Candidatus Melainabacteria bacterium]|nr:MAG: phosphomannomutase/phosphoglucomutase [Candidatus Melainabacteria bacterium]
MGSGNKLFGAYDIRGTYGQALNEDFAFKLGRAFGRFLSSGERLRVLVGHDSRTHSPCLTEALIAGLTTAGHDVVNLSVASTPMIAWFGATNGFDASIAVTASHLGKEHNGFKLYTGKANPIGAGNGLKEIEKILNELEPVNGKKPGSVSQIDGVQQYIEYLTSMLAPHRRLKVAIDVGHGAAAPEVIELLRTCKSVDFVALSCTVDGEFPARSPNPLDEGALVELSKLVVDEKCDFGVAFDGDADRAIFVDENGTMIATDLMIGVVGAHLIENKGTGTVVFDLRASRSVGEHIESLGGKAVRTGVGTMFIKNNMVEHKAIFAGELSGHYYYGDMHDSDNAMRTLIEVINLVSRKGHPLSAHIEPLSRYSSSGEINLRVAGIDQVLRHLDEAITGGAKDHIDGLSVNFPQWWFAARGSQTEPVLRLTVGAVSREILEEQTKHLIGVINQVKVPVVTSDCN